LKFVLYGAGGHGRVVADILAETPGADAVGFIDDDPSRHGQVVGKLRVLGGPEQLPRLRDEGVTRAIVTIGANRLRTSKAQTLIEAGLELATAIHPSAVLAPDVVVGAGTVVMAAAVMNTGTRIGRNAIINTGATVDHDCVVGDGAHVSPGVNLAGNVHLGDEAHVGIGCSVIPGVRIGAGSTVGAGAVVLRDIPPHETWVGNPARRIEHDEVEEKGRHGPA
jgi:sugar O-acyltransferase (sialic acid O-acetyltransferase NeuD family)